MTDDVFAKNLKNYIVSDRTLREDHLITAFANCLVRLGVDLSEWEGVIEQANISAKELVMDERFYTDDAYVDYAIADCMEALIEQLELNAPDGYRFGTHEGDSVCFGYWKVDDDA